MAIFNTAPNVLLASVLRLPEREANFVWVGRLFHESIALYGLRERNLRIRSATDLANYRIGTPRDSASHQQLLRLGVSPAQLETVGDPVQNVRKLLAGRLDLITAQPAVLAWHSRQEGLTVNPFQRLYPVLPASDFWLTASPGSDPLLIAKLRAALTRLERTGTLAVLRTQAGLEDTPDAEP